MREEGAKFEIDSEEYTHWSSDRVIQLDVEGFKALFSNVCHGLSHANFPFIECPRFDIEKVEHKFVVVEVFAEAYVVDCVSKDALKCMWKIDSRLTILFNFS